MKRLLYTLLVVIFAGIAFSGFAQKDYSARLKQEIVKIEGGKYTAQDFLYLTFNDGTTRQVKLSASSPTDVMSRDNFISFYSTYGTMFLLSIFHEANIETPDIKELDELIGDPDLTINFIMAKNGMQIQIITNEGRENITMKWDEIFED